MQGFVNSSNSPVASLCAQLTRHTTLIHQSAILRAGMNQFIQLGFVETPKYDA